ncbi:MAG: hypothetical protein WC943_03305, partial [Elusimicrobiota bacterium]
MSYLEKAFHLRGVVLSKIYGTRGVKEPDLDKLAASFAGVDNSSQLNAERIRLLTAKSRHFDPSKFSFHEESLKRFARRRLSLKVPAPGDAERRFLDRIRIEIGRRAGGIEHTAMLLRLIHPDRYPMFSA